MSLVRMPSHSPSGIWPDGPVQYISLLAVLFTTDREASTTVSSSMVWKLARIICWMATRLGLLSRTSVTCTWVASARCALLKSTRKGASTSGEISYSGVATASTRTRPLHRPGCLRERWPWRRGAWPAAITDGHAPELDAWGSKAVHEEMAPLQGRCLVSCGGRDWDELGKSAAAALHASMLDVVPCMVGGCSCLLLD
eukprot:scaffold1437_cov353-Prasinococcus_capsulatus_cf.AAC.2